MRLTVVTFGSRGDVEPGAVLGARLAAEGHDVRVAADPQYAPLMAKHGVEMVELPSPDIVALVRERRRGAATAEGSSRNPVKYMRGTRELIAPHARSIFENTLKATEDAEALVIFRTAVAAYMVAEARGLPFAEASVYPLVPTRAFPSLWLPGVPSLGGPLNLASHRAAMWANWAVSRSLVNELREEVLGLPALGRDSPMHRFREEGRTFVIGVSPQLLPRPADWPPEVELTGFWLSPPSDGPLDDELEAFLGAGEPPLFFGFGKLGVDAAEEQRFWDGVLTAIRRVGRRAVVQGAPASVSGDGIHAVTGTLDYARLFPRVATVVSHGGLGTVALALRAGATVAAVPATPDMFFLPKRAALVGTGADPIPRRRFDADKLTTALRRALEPGVAAKARDLGARLREEDGPGVAVRALERALGT